MGQNIQGIVDGFNTTPFIFAGSGITRRYLNLPDWKGLLSFFARKVKDDEFVYASYVNKAETMGNREGIMPKVAELIQRDFDKKWFEDDTLRTLNDKYMQMVKEGVSPFKAEIAQYLSGFREIEGKYQREVELLGQIVRKSVSGIITTNYDTFLEGICEGYRTYVGQDELIFSPIQGIAEIYKIHGSVRVPESIVINEKDYVRFNEKSAYLAAKLLTIFMEYPIIFLGYSISDSNIQKILRAIVNCLNERMLRQLADRFVFVEYREEVTQEIVTSYMIMVDDKPLEMKKVTLSDFSVLYNELAKKKMAIPVKILRKFKEELYNFTLTNTPVGNLRVAYIDDGKVEDEDLALAIGRLSEFGAKGLRGLESNEWYRNVVLDDLEVSADDLLEMAYPVLIRENSAKLPLNKYISAATREFPECVRMAEKNKFDAIISNTIKKSRHYLGEYRTVKEIWEGEKNNIEKATRLIAYLCEEQINVADLEGILREIFAENADILSAAKPSVRSNIRRLILIYDYLKWGKQKSPAQKHL